MAAIDKVPAQYRGSTAIRAMAARLDSLARRNRELRAQASSGPGAMDAGMVLGGAAIAGQLDARVGEVWGGRLAASEAAGAALAVAAMTTGSPRALMAAAGMLAPSIYAASARSAGVEVQIVAPEGEEE